ncbi:MAG: hypothetical protein WDW36_002502 [Sanguina aurantia]
MAPFNEDGRFMGRWNIVRSTLGMWDPKGGKQSPCLIYESFDGKGWAEHVEYQTAGVLSSTLQTRRIFGRDTIHGTGNPRGFKWRGAGLLSWVTCECEMAQLWRFTQGMQMCSRALWDLPASEFPTHEVYGMTSMSGYVAGFTNVHVHAAAQRHLCNEFCSGVPEMIFWTPSCRAQFLLLGHAAVFVLMDGRYTVNFSDDVCVQLFKDWCRAPSGSLPAFSPVMDAARKQLLHKFGDVSAIIASPALLFAWLEAIKHDRQNVWRV